MKKVASILFFTFGKVFTFATQNAKGKKSLGIKLETLVNNLAKVAKPQSLNEIVDFFKLINGFVNSLDRLEKLAMQDYPQLQRFVDMTGPKGGWNPNPKEAGVSAENISVVPGKKFADYPTRTIASLIEKPGIKTNHFDSSVLMDDSELYLKEFAYPFVRLWFGAAQKVLLENFKNRK